MKKKITSYEGAMKELEGIVANLQGGTTKIDDLTDQVERAAALMEYCKKKLKDTEATINRVLEE